MRAGGPEAAVPRTRGEAILVALCHAAALAGGAILIGLTALSVVSILGRWLSGFDGLADLAGRWLGPVPGDFELVEMGTAAAVFAFLPYCQLTRGHVTVDVFTMWAGPRLKAFLTLVADLLFAAVSGVLAWRVVLGLLDKARYGESSMILAVPLWWGYVPAAAFLTLLCVTCLHTARIAARELGVRRSGGGPAYAPAFDRS